MERTVVSLSVLSWRSQASRPANSCHLERLPACAPGGGGCRHLSQGRVKGADEFGSDALLVCFALVVEGGACRRSLAWRWFVSDLAICDVATLYRIPDFVPAILCAVCVVWPVILLYLYSWA